MLVTFREEQRFTQRWLWIVLIIMTLVLVGVFAYGFIAQLVFNKPWGERPVSDNALIFIGGAIIIFSVGMLYIFYTLRLITEVRPEGLYIRFYPLRSKILPYSAIRYCQARTYKPLSEFGGWGLKYGRSGWAYTILGDQGVQLIMDNDKRILIGSQNADALEQAIKRNCAC